MIACRDDRSIRRSHSETGCAARLLFVILIVPLATPSRAQITTNTALPVTRGHGIVRLQARVATAADDPTDMDRTVRTVATPFVGAAGLHPRVALFGFVPFVRKRLRMNADGHRIERSTAGIGDVRVFVRYTAVRRDRKARTIRLAPLAGMEFPTGEDDAGDALGRLPSPIQPGSGSWDPFVGLVLTRQTLAWQLDVVTQYQRNGSAGQVDFGDEARLDVALKTRVLPRSLSTGTAGFLYVNLELNLVRKGRDSVHGQAAPDTGGTTWYGAPGVQYITRKTVLEAAVQMPLVRI